MAPSDKLASALEALRELQKRGRRVFESCEFNRRHRELLLRQGFLEEVIRGWLISSTPSARQGDTTAWYASFWEFCARYCASRFGSDWHLSAEQSLLLHGENTIMPAQLIVNSPRATNNRSDLISGTSIYDLKVSRMPPEADLVEREGLRLYTPEAALMKATEALFTRHPIELQVVLAGISDITGLLRRLLEESRPVVAGRMAGAFRRIGRAAHADEILAAMKAAGHQVWETDPFAPQAVPSTLPPVTNAIVARMRAMWSAMRDPVLEVFPAEPGLPRDRRAYLRFLDDSYRNDAYHSLSIEGFAVSPELVERVKAGGWDPEALDSDRRNRDALAARGYWQAFQLVKNDVARTIAGANAAAIVRETHRAWYRELFQPCVATGLIPPAAMAGYRNDAVYLRTSRYVPPRWEAVRDAMPALFDLLESEPEAAVRAVLGHWLFGYIHPYPDGNGRLARFLMNVMLASGGYAWTILRVDDRAQYLSALDSASIDLDILPFARFIAGRVKATARSARTRR